MKHLLSILLTACVCVGSFAQTPYDSFAPETSRPMLELPGPKSSPDTLFCAIVADMSNQTLLLVDVSSREIIATAPITDDLRKWLSVDPLADNYPGISPYAYAAWNPIKYVDPDGCFSMENIDGGTNYETILVLPSESLRKDMEYKKRRAFDETQKQARAVNMPTMYVDNAQDYADAMAELDNMHSATDSYVLSTSHGYIGTDINGITIGTDMFTNVKGDFSQFCAGLIGKTVFITACELTSNAAGIDLIQRFASETNSTIIGADSSIPAHLGGLLGGNLNLSPFINAILGVFGGNYQNSFHMTNGTTTDRVYNLTIDKNRGIRWNSGNKGIFTK